MEQCFDSNLIDLGLWSIKHSKHLCSIDKTRITDSRCSATQVVAVSEFWSSLRARLLVASERVFGPRIVF